MIKRSAAQRQHAIAKAAAVADIAWVVVVKRDGTREVQGTHHDPNEAYASVRELRRAGHMAWRERAVA